VVVEVVAEIQVVLELMVAQTVFQVVLEIMLLQTQQVVAAAAKTTQAVLADQELSTSVTQPIKASQPIRETQRMVMEPQLVALLLLEPSVA
jgi:hypothetical protein